jgi:hypothetical protein
MIRNAFILSLLFYLSSCATLFTGVRDRIYFNSSPAGASVIINGKEICQTPCSTKVWRGMGSPIAQIELEGYKAELVTLTKDFNLVSLLNIPILPAVLIDIASGSIQVYAPKAYEVELTPLQAMLDEANTELQKIEVNTEEKTVRFVGVNCDQE